MKSLQAPVVGEVEDRRRQFLDRLAGRQMPAAGETRQIRRDDAETIQAAFGEPPPEPAAQQKSVHREHRLARAPFAEIQIAGYVSPPWRIKGLHFIVSDQGQVQVRISRTCRDGSSHAMTISVLRVKANAPNKETKIPARTQGPNGS